MTQALYLSHEQAPSAENERTQARVKSHGVLAQQDCGIRKD
jgi:hypothetical protein